MTGDGSGLVGSLHVSRMGLSPGIVVLRSGHSPRVVRGFCFVKCDLVGFDVSVEAWLWMRVGRRGWIPAYAGMT